MPGRDVLRLRTMLDAPDANAAPGTPQVFAASGTADLSGGPIAITGAAAVTVTIPAPTATQDDFKVIPVFCTTAQAHVLSFGANKLDGNKTSFTWTKAVAGLIGFIIVYQGVCYFTAFGADTAAYAQQGTLA